LFRNLQLHAPPVRRIDGFVNKPALEQLVGNGRDERAAEMKMLRHAVDVHVALFGIEMPDRNQGGVFDADKADAGRMAAADGFMPRQETKQAVDQSAKLSIRAVDQKLRPRNRERGRSVSPADLARQRTGGARSAFADGVDHGTSLRLVIGLRSSILE